MGEYACLVKFGPRDHLVELRDEGLLYMNCLSYFWRIEDDELRGDPNDGVARIDRGPKVKLFASDGSEMPVKLTDWTLRLHPSEPDRVNVYCMYALRPSAGTFPVDSRNLRFGDYAVAVTDVPQFYERIVTLLRADGISGRADLVEYVDDDYRGEVGPLRKLHRFAYQSEWRLVCSGGPGGARRLRIGSIADISLLVPSNEVNTSVQMCS